jgi:negative regulator of sigma-B (phosphoserine phosphatase)
MPDKVVEWSSALQVCQGEVLSGDHYVTCQMPNRMFIAVLDGIGHGPEAARASHMAASVLEAHADESILSLFSLCHDELIDTRGVVMTLAILDLVENTVAWLGVGNVRACLLRADKTSLHSTEELLTYGGVVGHQMPPVLVFSVLPICAGDILILVTDGISPDFLRSVYPGKSAYHIANDILATHSRTTDDALVMVAKYQKEAP